MFTRSSKIHLLEEIEKVAGIDSRGLVVKNPPANAGVVGLIPGLRRTPREENATDSSTLA